MRTLWLVVLAGCWSTSSKPASAPAPAPAAESSASAAGGGAYGGGQYAALVGVGAFATLEGTGDISSGFEASPGGGAVGTGTIGTGTYGTIGNSSGTGYGLGSAPRGSVPMVTIGTPSTQGDLDKAIIRRYIKRNQQKIQYCYEKELLVWPGIKGKVVVDFEISVDGTVAQATGTAERAAGKPLQNVADCVAAVVKNIEFPKPKGGTSVQVSYPFVFDAPSSP